MNKGNSTSLPVSLLSALGLCLALVPTTAQATKYIPTDTTIGTWDSTNRIYTLTKDVSEGIQVMEDSLTLDGAGHTVAGTGSGKGVDLTGREYSTIENLTVENFRHGISLSSSTDNKLIDNTTSRNSEYGIFLSDSSDNILEGNTASHSVTGIFLFISSDNKLIGNTASYNREGIYLSDSNNNALTSNTALLNGDGITLVSSRASTLEDNTASHNHQSGIFLSVSNDNALTGNTASNNSESGIELGSSDSNTLEGNTAENNSEYGIVVWNSGSNTIYNNYFNNNTNVKFGGTILANTWNTTKALGTNIVGGPYLGGNFWAKPDGTGFSQTHPDEKGDGICDQVYTLATGNVDNLPLAPHSPVSLSIIIYPNPSSLNQAGLVTFSNLPLEPEVRVYIYDLGGILVRVLKENDTVIEGGSKTVTWNLKNDREEMVARGIYIYFILSASEKRTGKIAIIK